MRQGHPCVTGLEIFSDQIFDEILRHADEVFPISTSPVMMVDVDRQVNAAFIASAKSFVHRTDPLRELTNYLNLHQSAPLLLSAPSGAGKTALLLDFLNVYSANRPGAKIVISAHFSDAAPCVADVRRVVRRICEDIASAYDLKIDAHYVAGTPPQLPFDLPLLTKVLHELLERVVNAYVEKDLVVVVDDLARIFETGCDIPPYDWLPLTLPTGGNAVRFIAAVESGDAEADVLRRFKEAGYPPKVGGGEVFIVYLFHVRLLLRLTSKAFKIRAASGGRNRSRRRGVFLRRAAPPQGVDF